MLVTFRNFVKNENLKLSMKWEKKILKGKVFPFLVIIPGLHTKMIFQLMGIHAHALKTNKTKTKHPTESQ